MRKSAPINVIVHCPATGEGQRELARRVSGVRADFVTDAIRRLNCPTSQKLALLNAVTESARQQKQEHNRRQTASGPIR
ncbi:MAG: hypothetical protein E7316_00825 [Clostridiales bacterium]|nr:hypothetical protein [Clostridiales bacterium]